MVPAVADRRKRSNVVGLAIIGGGLFFVARSIQQAVAAEPGREGIPTGVPMDGEIRIFVLDVGQTFSPLQAISPEIVIRNGKSIAMEVALAQDVRRQGRDWVSAGRSVPFEVHANTEDQVVMPAFAIEPGARFRGPWDYRVRLWDETGATVARRTAGEYLRIS